ncbi:MAG: hypothetical protein LBB52_03530 [Desulfovibrio sp.]|jgi:hypothetical protein|nr:hypothetical protein [Desulfovibrio sp.]
MLQALILFSSLVSRGARALRRLLQMHGAGLLSAESGLVWRRRDRSPQLFEKIRLRLFFKNFGVLRSNESERNLV